MNEFELKKEAGAADKASDDPCSIRSDHANRSDSLEGTSQSSVIIRRGIPGGSGSVISLPERMYQIPEDW